MREERVGETLIDRCEYCGGIWFDSTELDACVAPTLPAGAQPPEVRIPARGRSVRRCPRCDIYLGTAGWSGLVLDRCPTCRGLFVELSEWAYLKAHEAPRDAQSFEADLRDALVSAGWALFSADGLVATLTRVWR